MAGNSLGKPFGHPIYQPILTAASEQRLPLVIHTGGDSPPNTLSHPLAGGLSGTYVEYQILRSHSIMAHLTSLVGQGHFDRHSGLRVLVVGAGVTWFVSWLWRFDAEHKALGSSDAPWLTRIPSAYVFERVRLATYSCEPEGFDARQVSLLRKLPGIEDLICFGSGRPNWDASDPGIVSRSLPVEWRARIMGDNGRQLLRWRS
jgi:uncharacterized protein